LSVSNQNQPEDPLKIYVYGLKFTRTSYLPIAIPFILLLTSTVFLSIGIPSLLETYLRSGMGEVTSESMFKTLFFNWGLVLLGGYTIASAFSSYYLLKKLFKHIYDSAVTTYYYTGRSSLESLVNILDYEFKKHTLPAPTTGLILSILTAGIAYPVLLLISESALRDHALIEEKTLLKTQITSTRREIDIAVDIALLLVTLGAYGLYIALRYMRVYNKHYELIHSSHPNPPSQLLQGNISIETTPSTYSLLLTIVIITPLITTIYSILGLTPLIFIPISSGIILGASIFTMGKKGARKAILTAFTLLYVVLISGFITGLLQSGSFGSYYESIERNLSRYAGIEDPLLQILVIYLNNFSIAISAVIPIIGQYYLASGVYNAGLVIGYVLSTNTGRSLDVLRLLLLPHTLMEILAYSIIASSSTYLLSNQRVFIKLLLIGLIVLFLAALVEEATILILK
jgi:hypothetical protein